MRLFDVAPLPDYHPEIGLLLSAMQDSTREWRDNLGDPPVEAITWQPSPQGYSIGALILHLIDAEDFWFCNFVGGQERKPEDSALFLSDELDQYEGQWPAPPEQPIQWYFDLHDRIRIRTFAALQGIEPTRQFDRPERNRKYTLRWIVAHVLEHDSYTGGQAVALHELWKKQTPGG
jgi:uncharacterized damage-inducible protein DinB